MIITAGVDRQIKVWDPRSIRPAFVFEGHDRDITSLCSFSGSNLTGQIASGSLDGTVKLWDLRSENCTKEFDIGSEVRSLEFYARNNKLFVGSEYLNVSLGTQGKALLN